MVTNYPRRRNTRPGWELPDTQDEEIHFCSLLRITQDEKILYMATNYQIPKRKKYWTWLGITQEEEILDLAGNPGKGAEWVELLPEDLPAWEPVPVVVQLRVVLCAHVHGQDVIRACAQARASPELKNRFKHNVATIEAMWKSPFLSPSGTCRYQL